MENWALCSIILYSLLVPVVWSHARMVDPPMRSSMWRFGFNVPKNYNDGELNCGGFMNQWFVSGGRCGACGDPFQGPRLNEAGNKYGNGIIVKTYNNSAAIEVKIDLTASHKGYFQFQLCVHNNLTTPVSEDCFDRYLLYIHDSHGTKYYITNEALKLQTITVQLPSDVICSHCVLRWKYNTGNSWGCRPDGTCGIGLGKQEQFYNCADISIVETSSPTTISSQSSTVDVLETTTTKSNVMTSEVAPKTTRSTGYATSATPTRTTHQPTKSTVKSSSSTSPTKATATSPASATASTLANIVGHSTTMHTDGCPNGQLSCKGVKPFDAKHYDAWCDLNCNFVPKFCPKSYCNCICRL